MYQYKADRRRRKKANISLHPPPKTGDNVGFVGKQRLLAPPAQPPPVGKSLRYARHRYIKFLEGFTTQPTSKIIKDSQRKCFWVRHSNCRRIHASVWKHPPPLYGGSLWRHPHCFHPPPRNYAEHKNDDSPRCGWGSRFINKTNQKTGIRETLNAFPGTKRLETVRSI